MSQLSTFREAFIKTGRLYLMEQFIIVFEVRNTKELITIPHSFIYLQPRLNFHDYSTAALRSRSQTKW